MAGPYSNGGRERNVDDAISAAHFLRELGHYPFIPHLAHFWDLAHPRTYADWMAWCIEWLSVCECLVRLPGASPGADAEVAYAELKGIPVYYGIGDFVRKTAAI